MEAWGCQRLRFHRTYKLIDQPVPIFVEADEDTRLLGQTQLSKQHQQFLLFPESHARDTDGPGGCWVLSRFLSRQGTLSSGTLCFVFNQWEVRLLFVPERDITSMQLTQVQSGQALCILWTPSKDFSDAHVPGRWPLPTQGKALACDLMCPWPRLIQGGHETSFASCWLYPSVHRYLQASYYSEQCTVRVLAGNWWCAKGINWKGFCEGTSYWDMGWTVRTPLRMVRDSETIVTKSGESLEPWKRDFQVAIASRTVRSGGRNGGWGAEG